jgi:hypothetical protein
MAVFAAATDSPGRGPFDHRSGCRDGTLKEFVAVLTQAPSLETSAGEGALDTLRFGAARGLATGMASSASRGIGRQLFREAFLFRRLVEHNTNTNLLSVMRIQLRVTEEILNE